MLFFFSMLLLILFLPYQKYATLDIDECTEGTNRCEQNCQNIVGSYYCWCDSGFRLDRNRRDCDGKGY